MSDLIRVPGPSSPLEGRSAKVIAVIVIGVLVAIVKPWGTITPGPAAPVASPTGSLALASPRSSLAIPNYNPEVFGLYEPTPSWELWPAGYLVSFGFATRIESGAVASPQPVAPSSSTEPAPPEPTASARSPNPPDGSGDPQATQPVWPSTIRFSSGSHLSLLGINTPLGYAVTEVTLTRTDPSGRESNVATVLPPSPWPAHFTVVAIDAGNGRDPEESWPPGTYVFRLQFEPGAISRHIEIVIDAPPTPTATP
jgi:hypothetical protein